ncbi:hypothetical protein DAA48_21705 [Aeromonas veronii]|uniref:Uncharacterized protein n=2 Tax=Aeromonas veronii TaxID=654 RepID=A0A2T4MX71_AERVE|nr:hypothetical protein DAA48_21705 [Aeromonas veronii]
MASYARHKIRIITMKDSRTPSFIFCRALDYMPIIWVFLMAISAAMLLISYEKSTSSESSLSIQQTHDTFKKLNQARDRVHELEVLLQTKKLPASRQANSYLEKIKRENPDSLHLAEAHAVNITENGIPFIELKKMLYQSYSEMKRIQNQDGLPDKNKALADIKKKNLIKTAEKIIELSSPDNYGKLIVYDLQILKKLSSKSS